MSSPYPCVTKMLCLAPKSVSRSASSCQSGLEMPPSSGGLVEWRTVSSKPCARAAAASQSSSGVLRPLPLPPKVGTEGAVPAARMPLLLLHEPLETVFPKPGLRISALGSHRLSELSNEERSRSRRDPPRRVWGRLAAASRLPPAGRRLLPIPNLCPARTGHHPGPCSVTAPLSPALFPLNFCVLPTQPTEVTASSLSHQARPSLRASPLNDGTAASASPV